MDDTSKYAPKAGQLESVRDQLVGRHEGEQITFATCVSNGCQDMCILRTHLKDGKVTAIETDTSVHRNIGREDEYVDFEDFRKGLYQRRACARGRGMRSDINSPTRIKYPMKRVGERGEGKFERITWDEALDTIAKWYKETREKYGPLSVYADGMLGDTWDPWGPHLPGGCIGTWAADSFEPANTADQLMYANSSYTEAYATGAVSGNVEAMTFFDSDLIVLWGWDVAVNYQEYAYYLALAKEMGKPIITIDPRYSWTAETFATQHIYIRPGTDLALALAMCYVMFDEDLIDHEFVDKWVEPTGLEKFKEYVMGTKYNEEPKTPEWAEYKCGVPAETIRDFTRLYAAQDAVHMRIVLAATRQYGGKEVGRAVNCLKVLGGNIGKKGCAGTCAEQPGPSMHYARPYVAPYLQDVPGEYGCTVCMEAEMWHDAVLLRPKLEAGEISMDEYKEAIGCAKSVEAPNIHFICSFPSMRNSVCGWYDSNKRIEALKMVDHFVLGHWNFEQPTVPYADILLPVAHNHLDGVRTTWGPTMMAPAFESGHAPSVPNCFMYASGGAEPVGEAAYNVWAIHQIAMRLGIGDKVYGALGDCKNEDTPKIIEAAAKQCYEDWRNRPQMQYGGKGLKVADGGEPPEWDKFLENPVIQVPEDDYFVFFEQNRAGDIPLMTESGKIEFYSEMLADADMTKVIVNPGGRLTPGGHMPPLAKWKPQPGGFLSKRSREYPLMMVTSHSYFRHHTAYDHSDMFNDEFRPSIWMSVADANARGIKDNDRVLVSSPTGEVICYAYVTSRMLPGIVNLPFGRYYQPSTVKTEKMPYGVDLRGSCNFLIPDEFFDDGKGACLDNAMVQVERIGFQTKAPMMMEVE